MDVCLPSVVQIKITKHVVANRDMAGAVDLCARQGRTGTCGRSLCLLLGRCHILCVSKCELIACGILWRFDTSLATIFPIQL